MNLASGFALLATTASALILKVDRGAQAFLHVLHLSVLSKQWAAPQRSAVL